MKILLSAIGCDPFGGSELYFGWAAVECLAKDNELWVLTSPRAKPNIERAQAQGSVPDNVHFVYVGAFKEWHPNRLLARLQSWREYKTFSGQILDTAEQLHRTVRFDVAHHVTYATWRVASPLWKLGIPFVFGPIGGYEQFPSQLFRILSPSAAAFELVRIFYNNVSRFSPTVRSSIRNASHIFAANPETEWLAKKIRNSNSQSGVSRLSAGFYSEKRVKAFSRFLDTKVTTGPLRIFAGGNLEGRKGVALALMALARAKERGLKFSYRLGSQGPELAYLKKLSDQLGLQNEVIFGPTLTGDAYERELSATHVFLLPSLRESAGLTMMEAMLAGCVPIVADCGGPSHIVTKECGYKIPVSALQKFVANLTEALLAVDQDRERITILGKAASARISTHFTEQNYRQAVNSIYVTLVP